MNAHYLQHVPFEGLGSIAPWLEKKGIEVSSTKFFESSALPDPQSIDFLIIMGGPMSVNDTKIYPWLRLEIQFIKEVIALEKPVLGICLGAQLIARAMGSRVYANREKEIGWFPVHKVAATSNFNFSFPPSTVVFHWHGETFDLPENSILLASSEGCENQAFQIGSSVIGLQFHLETIPQSAHEIVSNCGSELVPSRYIQTETELRSATPEMYASINNLMESILNYLVPVS